MARPEGFEPPTAWFVARYSIQLSYGRTERAIMKSMIVAVKVCSNLILQDLPGTLNTKFKTLTDLRICGISTADSRQGVVCVAGDCSVSRTGSSQNQSRYSR